MQVWGFKNSNNIAYSIMFIFDEPYISDIAMDYLIHSQQPVLPTSFSSKVMPSGINFVSDDEARLLIEQSNNGWLYTNSENAIARIVDLLGSESALMNKVQMFKNKLRFRVATEGFFPDIYFREISKDEIEPLAFDSIGRPFIIKPTVGFLSAGVYRVDNEYEWNDVKNEIIEKTNSGSDSFSKDVIDGSKFLIESIVEGVEYAIDAYFDDNNEPVILNILEHRFNGVHDMGDRLYVTSVDIIRKNFKNIEKFLKDIGSIDDFRGFPLHAEVRIDEEGVVRPIEVNPLRFAGWCSTDIAYYAFDINVYEYFIEKKRPFWDEIFKGKEGCEFAIAILEKNKVVPENCHFDYESLQASLTSLIAIRPIDYRNQPLFAFMFIKVDSGNSNELLELLTLDPQRYVKPDTVPV
ncbi:MAG: hypothetical protein ACI8ZB_000977 [Desulforhopalus sp.]